MKWFNKSLSIKVDAPLEDLFEDAFSTFDSLFSTVNYRNDFPVIRSINNNDRLLVEFDLPGWKKTDIKVLLSGNKLNVSGQLSKQEGRSRTARSSRFSNTINLGSNYALDTIEAKYEDGILTITIEKFKNAPQQQSKVITVK